MGAFFSLFMNLFPLYLLIAAGYGAVRYLHVDRQSLGTLAIYIFMPIVVFGFVADMEFQPSYIALPIFFYILSVIIGLGFFKLGEYVYEDKQKNLLAMLTSMGNTGYYGLPLVLLFFDKDTVAIYIFMTLGGLVYEATVGYYIAARSNFTVKESLAKLTRFPVMYAMALGFAVNAIDVELPEIFWTYWTHFKGAYVIAGMMIIGGALAGLEKFVFGPRLLGLVFLGKFILTPILSLIFIGFDKAVTQWYGPDIYNLLIIVAIVPPAANIAAYATQMNIEPEKAATTILIGTVFALFYIPLVIWFIGL